MKYHHCLIPVVLITLWASHSQAATLSFEELHPSPAQFDALPNPYQGFTFTGWYFGPDTIYTPASGAIDLFTDYADPTDPTAFVVTNSNNQINSAAPFVFDGAWFSGYSGVRFELWFGGILVHTSAALPDAPSIDPYLPTFLSSGYSGKVDRIVVSGVQGYYAMDDFTFHSISSVPELPTHAMLLLAIGIGGIAQFVRTRPTAEVTLPSN